MSNRVFNGKRLKELRGKWTQSELAQEVGITDVSLSKLETGAVKNPTPATVDKLAKYFTVTPESLWTQKTTTPRKKTAPVINIESKIDAKEVEKVIAKMDELTSLTIVDEFKDGSLFVKSRSGQLYRATRLS